MGVILGGDGGDMSPPIFQPFFLLFDEILSCHAPLQQSGTIDRKRALHSASLWERAHSFQREGVFTPRYQSVIHVTFLLLLL